MKHFAAVLTSFLAAAASAAAPRAQLETVQTLHGAFAYASCPKGSTYPGTYAVIRLAKPIRVESLGTVKQVELILKEQYFVQYNRFVGKPGVIVCTLTTSPTCGPSHATSHAMCAPASLELEP
jgi:hypothetical protein